VQTDQQSPLEAGARSPEVSVFIDSYQHPAQDGSDGGVEKVSLVASPKPSVLWEPGFVVDSSCFSQFGGGLLSFILFWNRYTASFPQQAFPSIWFISSEPIAARGVKAAVARVCLLGRGGYDEKRRPGPLHRSDQTGMEPPPKFGRPTYLTHHMFPYIASLSRSHPQSVWMHRNPKP
ncbi:unnamed protein product, partial [Symbiodinium sp. CCMP2456]